MVASYCVSTFFRHSIIILLLFLPMQVSHSKSNKTGLILVSWTTQGDVHLGANFGESGSRLELQRQAESWVIDAQLEARRILTIFKITHIMLESSFSHLFAPIHTLVIGESSSFFEYKIKNKLFAQLWLSVTTESSNHLSRKRVVCRIAQLIHTCN